MPELPEVETARRDLNAWLAGRPVARVLLDRPRAGEPRAMALRRALGGARAGVAARRGKHLLLPFRRGACPAPALHLHLGMTGRLALLPPGVPRPRGARARIVRADGFEVLLLDPRRFGRIRLTDAGGFEALEGLPRLGPDPMLDDWGPGVLEAALDARRRPLKSVLMDQTRIAGLGNIQATEALFSARIHPLRPAASLNETELTSLSAAITGSIDATLADLERRRAAATRSFESGHARAFLAPLYVSEGADSPFRIYGRSGQPCPRCATPVDSVRIDGRSSAFCPRCQVG